MQPKFKMKVTIEFEADTNAGDNEKHWFCEYCDDVELAIIKQDMYGSPYLFNWDAIVKAKYRKFKERLKNYEIFE